MRNRLRCFVAVLGFVSLWSAWSAEVSTAPLADVPPAQLDAFMQKWKTYKSFEGPANTDIPLLLAALKKDPKGTWATYLTMNADTAHSQARRRRGAERTNLFAATLAYLTPARVILADALSKNPRDEDLQYHHGDVLGFMAEAAFESGRPLGEVKGAVQEMLANNIDTNSWNYGNVIYDANGLLGRIAIREGDVSAAKKYLLTAGKTPGSPQLNSFGPHFTLARELMEKGEPDTVLDFLDLVGKFWADPEQKNANSRNVAAMNRKQLNLWKQEIQGGKIPTHPKWL